MSVLTCCVYHGVFGASLALMLVPIATVAFDPTLFQFIATRLLTTFVSFGREEVMEDASQAGIAPGGCRVIAFDRPPFGLSQRPLRWQGDGEDNPYTAEVPYPPKFLLETVFLVHANNVVNSVV